MIYDLPTALEVCGVSYEIRSDYRAILDICIALNDPALMEQEKPIAALSIMYPAFMSGEMPPEHYKEALEQCFWFIDRGEKHASGPRLVDWEKDFMYIIAPINKVVGQEVRAVEYMHWWTFIGAYMEIGECTFSQIVSIRDKKARNKQMDKWEKEWYRRNRDIVDFATAYTEEEKSVLSAWGGG